MHCFEPICDQMDGACRPCVRGYFGPLCQQREHAIIVNLAYFASIVCQIFKKSHSIDITTVKL